MGFYTGTIQHGSNNEDTKRWQEFLRSQGYNLDVDGIFGDITKGYTTDWQTKNGLTADGIVGENTWAKAGFSNANTPISAPTLQTYGPAPNLSYTNWGDTTEGQAAYKNKTDAYDAMTGYQPLTWANEDWYKNVMSAIQNRPDFSYDFNKDALYQQYKDKYIKQGKMAMADTIGQASAMTGGYGNSYAATAGNQAYQASLENLNDIIPELYQMAYDRYNQKGQDLYNQASLLGQDYDRSYAEWQDGYNKLVNEYGIASDDYYKGADLHNSEQSSNNSILQQNWQNGFDLVTKNNENLWNEADWDESARRYYLENEQKKISEVTGDSGGGSGGGSGGSGGGTGGGSGGDGGDLNPVPTDNTNQFIATIQTKAEYMRRGYNAAQYNAYIEDKLASFLRSDRLTEDEVKYLINHYELE